MLTASADLQQIVDFCDQRTRRIQIKDFAGAYNGLQLENSGSVRRIGAAVDAGIAEIEAAAADGVDFLIVHHGLFWNPPIPLTGSAFRKIRTATQADLAVYGSHLPLDAHPEIGNNALLAQRLGLVAANTFLPYEGNDIGLVATFSEARREELRLRLESLFPRVTSVEFGSCTPSRIAILTGSGSSAVDKLPGGVDTLITGELRQQHYTYAQEKGLNLYCAGHWATEVFGVQALAQEVATRFQLPFTFIPSSCPW